MASFPTHEWKAYLPLHMVEGVEENKQYYRQQFHNKLPADGGEGIADQHLHCLIGQEWLSDYPLNKLGSCLGDRDTTYYNGSQYLCYIPSYHSQKGSIIPLGTENIPHGSDIFMFGYNSEQVHWNLALFSAVLNKWLILDSMRRSMDLYGPQISDCHTALIQYGCRVPLDAVVVVAEWLTQPNGFDCGAYTCLAMMFIARNARKGGYMDTLFAGNNIVFPALPKNFIATLREELYVLSKLIAEPYTPAFQVLVAPVV